MAIEEWRASLPNEFRVSSATIFSRLNLCVIVVHVLFHQINTVFHRTVCRRLSVMDQRRGFDYRKQLHKATYEASKFLRQAVICDGFRLAPPFV